MVAAAAAHWEGKTVDAGSWLVGTAAGSQDAGRAVAAHKCTQPLVAADHRQGPPKVAVELGTFPVVTMHRVLGVRRFRRQ